MIGVSGLSGTMDDAIGVGPAALSENPDGLIATVAIHVASQELRILYVRIFMFEAVAFPCLDLIKSLMLLAYSNEKLKPFAGNKYRNRHAS